MEDEIWTKIRIEPRSLPTGSLELIPGSQHLRFSHGECGPEKAEAHLKEANDPNLSVGGLMEYKLTYKDLNRTLTILFEKEFPHQIVKWTEEVESGFGSNKKILTTAATKTHQIKSPYWSKNGVSDSIFRAELGLKF